MPSVVKHRYLTGRNLRGRAAAHLNYIQYRPGEDREGPARSARSFFSPDSEDEKASYDFRQSFKELTNRDVVHKFILSPGVNGVDAHAYTQEIMDRLSSAKGQDFTYGYVVHKNTDHDHIHLIVLGKDKEGGLVRFSKVDHMRMRAFGDLYLEREHAIERHLDKEVERFCRERGINIMFDAERGHQFYKLLERQDLQAERAAREFDWIDDDWKKILEQPDREGGHFLRGSSYHEIGKLSDLRELFNNDQENRFWEDIRDNVPDKRDIAIEKLAELKQDREDLAESIAERTQARDPWGVLDRVLEEMNQEREALDRVLNPEKYDLEEREPEPMPEKAPAPIERERSEQLEQQPSENIEATEESPLIRSLFRDVPSKSELDEIGAISKDRSELTLDRYFSPGEGGLELDLEAEDSSQPFIEQAQVAPATDATAEDKDEEREDNDFSMDGMT